jgi:hypothetical protein
VREKKGARREGERRKEVEREEVEVQGRGRKKKLSPLSLFFAHSSLSSGGKAFLPSQIGSLLVL